MVKYNKDKFGIPASRVYEVLYLSAAAVKSGKALVEKEEIQILKLNDFKI